VATEERPAAAPTPPGDARTVETVEEVIRARLSAALGGIRGSVETALPTAAFVAAWAWRHEVRTAVAASAVVALVLLVSRLVARQTPRYVLSAVAATAVAAFFALRSGRAEDAFLPGILASAGWGAAALVSVLARWPVVGFLVAAGDPRLADDPLGWRRDRGLVRVCQRLTMVLVGLYVLRVAVMLPMYLAGAVTLLGIAKIVLGWPAYLGAVALMGLILVRGRTAPAPQAEPEG
jgi:hypothetical protein